MGKSDTCWKCERHNKAASATRKCVVCDSVIRESYRRHLWYCSTDCSRIVSEARAGVAPIVGRLISTKEIPKASAFKCVDCGKDAMDYDHRKYMEPDCVVPVCRGCNQKRGPATDVKALIAKHFGIDVDHVAQFAIDHNTIIKRLRQIGRYEQIQKIPRKVA